MSPMSPRTPCLHPGCPALVTKADRGRCPEHKKAHEKALYRERGSAATRGYDSRWARFRSMYLAEHPLCGCGCGRAAEEIHHIVPVKGPDDPLFYEESNLLAMSKGCHSAVTQKTTNIQRKA